ncbi:hypothetical protein DERF_002071 [Dermatophagoides farinae]|uniref:Uncharacterized protein n=1 Tax=Dermatophagoides farinae TaxID=6954 RepID=A0A922LD72_DERFA|nr:hypothetical protein DERF_002071 [Dermatophagoides farinae]
MENGCMDENYCAKPEIKPSYHHKCKTFKNVTLTAVTVGCSSSSSNEEVLDSKSFKMSFFSRLD